MNLRSDHKESWAPKNWCFWTVVLKKTLESPLDCKEVQPVNPKENQSCIFIGRTDAEAEAQILWPPYTMNWVIGKDPDAGKDGRQEEKGMTGDEMVEWHHRLNGHEFEQASGVVDGQKSLACCSPWGCKELNMTEQLNWLNWKEPHVSHSTSLLPVGGNPIGKLRAPLCLCQWYRLARANCSMVRIFFSCLLSSWWLPWNSTGRESSCNPGDPGSIPGLGRSPGEMHGNPLQYSCLENAMDEERGGLQSVGSQRVGHDWATNTHTWSRCLIRT